MLSIWLSLCVLSSLVVGGTLWCRHKLISLKWPPLLLPLQITRRCKAYFALYGVKVELPESGADIDFYIMTSSSNHSLRKINVTCRDGIYISGESVFRNLREILTIGRNTDISILLTTTEFDGKLTAISKSYGIPVLHSTDLRDLAISLRNCKNKAYIEYNGRCELLRELFEAKSKAAMHIIELQNSALAAERSGDLDTAEVLWNNVLETDPESRYALHLAATLTSKSKFNEAEQILKNFIERFPSDHRGYCELAKLAEKKGDDAQAAEHWKKAILHFPDFWESHAGLANLHTSNGDIAAARSILDEFLRLRPKHVDAIRHAATLAETTDDLATAAKHWASFITIETGNPWAHQKLISALIGLGRTKEATRVAKKAAKHFPSELSFKQHLLKQ